MFWLSGRPWPGVESFAHTMNTVVLEREMGVSHNDFFRTLPSAMGSFSYRLEQHAVLAEHQGKRLRIELGPQQERRIALLRLPYTQVRFSFCDSFSQAEIDAFMTYFDSRFQRGGG